MLMLDWQVNRHTTCMLRLKEAGSLKGLLKRYSAYMTPWRLRSRLKHSCMAG